MLRYNVVNLPFAGAHYRNVKTLEEWGQATAWLSVESTEKSAYVPLYNARKQRAELWQLHPFVHVKPLRHGDGMAVVPEHTPLRLDSGASASYVSIGSDVQRMSFIDLTILSTFSSDISRMFVAPPTSQTVSLTPTISTDASDIDT